MKKRTKKINWSVCDLVDTLQKFEQNENETLSRQSILFIWHSTNTCAHRGSFTWCEINTFFFSSSHLTFIQKKETRISFACICICEKSVEFVSIISNENILFAFYFKIVIIHVFSSYFYGRNIFSSSSDIHFSFRLEARCFSRF